MLATAHALRRPATPTLTAHPGGPPCTTLQVPTDYYSLWGWRYHSCQYSVTEYYHQFKGGEAAPPAVFLL